MTLTTNSENSSAPRSGIVLNDIATATDSLDRIVDYNRDADESLKFEDFLSLNVQKVLADATLGTSDSFILNMEINIQDALASTEIIVYNFVKNQDFCFHVDENLVAVLNQLFVTVADIVVTSDSFVYDCTAQLNDIVNTNDVVSYNLDMIIPGDTVIITDTLAFDMSKVLSDVAGIVDDLTFILVATLRPLNGKSMNSLPLN